jgi:Flp pilus assembly CpaF family ATPase
MNRTHPGAPESPVDAMSPWVDARLPDGSRVQTRILSTPLSGGLVGALAPCALSGPVITPKASGSGEI